MFSRLLKFLCKNKIEINSILDSKESKFFCMDKK